MMMGGKKSLSLQYLVLALEEGFCFSLMLRVVATWPFRPCFNSLCNPTGADGHYKDFTIS